MAVHTGVVYYITTVQDWYKHISSIDESHWLFLNHNDPSAPDFIPFDQDNRQICVRIVAHESKHWELENDPAWTPLPHPLSGQHVDQALLNRFKGHPGIPTPVPPMNTFQLVTALAKTMPSMGWRLY